MNRGTLPASIAVGHPALTPLSAASTPDDLAMSPSPLFGIVLSLALTSSALAGAGDVSPELRQRALDSCTGDAMRLCPLSMTDEASAVSCMAGKRPLLTQSCRVVYDQVARVLRQ